MRFDVSPLVGHYADYYASLVPPSVAFRTASGNPKLERYNGGAREYGN